MSLIKLAPYIIDSTLDFTFNNVTATGNIASLNANLGNLATANYFTGTLTTGAQPNITTVGTLANLTVTGNISSAANVTAQYLIGNGSQLTSITGLNVTGFVPNADVANTAYAVAVANVVGIGNIATINKDGNASNVLYGNGVFAGAPVTYDDSNVATFLASFGSNSISTTGDISTGNVIANTTANFTGASNVALGAVGNIHITGGTNGQVLTTNGSGTLTWSTVSGGGGSSALSGLTDVTLTSPTNNQVLSYDSTSSKWINKTISAGGGGGASVSVSTTAPSSPSEGDMWLDSESGELNVYYSDSWGSVTETAPQFITTVNSFTGDSVTTDFTLSTTPATKDYTLVAIGGILQPRSTYSLSGNVISISSAVPSNTPIEVTILGGQAVTVAIPSEVNDLNISGNLTVDNIPVATVATAATTGKSIAMAIVFGF